MRNAHRIAPAVALALVGLAGAPSESTAQALIGGNGLQGGFAVNGLNNGFGGFNNGTAFGFGFGGPVSGGMVFSSQGGGFGGQVGGVGQPGFFPNAMVGAGMFPPQAYPMNNLGGVAAVVDQQVIRRPGQPLPAARRRRR